MRPAPILRWWPAVGIPAMILLGLAVGNGSTHVDDWFLDHGMDAHPSLRLLLIFTEPVLFVVLLASATGAALYRRRWRLAAVVALTPVVGVTAARMLKRSFQREHDGALAYPSGHVTVLTTVVGVALLVWGTRRWLLWVAGVFVALGVAGQALTYHYFTDTIGAAFLGTSLVAAAAWAAGLDTCQPRCDLDHSTG